MGKKLKTTGKFNTIRKYTVTLTGSEVDSLIEFSNDTTENYNPREDFKVIASQIKKAANRNSEIK